MDLRTIQDTHHAWVESVGWHNKSPLESLALIASEVGEAVNECRGEMTPYQTHNLGLELADVILRTVDFAKEMGIDIDEAVREKMAICAERGTRGRAV